MRISVITPSKNHGQYIEDCLRSVHGQTHREVEHIVIDGMSADSTAEICRRYPCQFVQRSDSGAAQAINRGLDMATGDIVCWLNSDDLFWSKTTLERVAGIFEEHADVDVITGNGYWVSEDCRLLKPIIGLPDRICAYWLRRNDFILQPATFWRRNRLRLDESLRYCFDWKLWVEFYEAGLNFLYVPEYFARYRMQSASLTFQDSASRKREVYEMVRRYSPRRTQGAWCWAVWKGYQLSETLQSPGLKRFTFKTNAWMSRLTNGSIASG